MTSADLIGQLRCIYVALNYSELCPIVGKEEIQGIFKECVYLCLSRLCTEL